MQVLLEGTRKKPILFKFSKRRAQHWISSVTRGSNFGGMSRFQNQNCKVSRGAGFVPHFEVNWPDAESEVSLPSSHKCPEKNWQLIKIQVPDTNCKVDKQKYCKLPFFCRISNQVGTVYYFVPCRCLSRKNSTFFQNNSIKIFVLTK